MLKTTIPQIQFGRYLGNKSIRELLLGIENLQKNVTSWIGLLGKDSEVTNGKMVSASLDAATPKGITHGLGRTPVGWMLCDLTTESIVHRDSWDTSKITLNASLTTTCKIWVF